MWFDIHKLMGSYELEGERFFLRYGKNEVYAFDSGGRIQQYDETLSVKNIKDLPKGQQSILCTNKDGQGFDQYIFNLYGRIVRNFMSDAIKTRLLSVKASAFRKIEVPGLSVKDEQRVRKVIYDYLTLLFLWSKNKELFIHVYNRRISSVLSAISQMEMDYNTMRHYVKVTKNAWILDLFRHKGMVTRMSKDWETVSRSNQEPLIIQHGDAFFELATRQIEG